MNERWVLILAVCGVLGVALLAAFIVRLRAERTGSPVVMRSRGGGAVLVMPDAPVRRWRVLVRGEDGTETSQDRQENQYRVSLVARRESSRPGVRAVRVRGPVGPAGEVTVWTWVRGEIAARRKVSVWDLPDSYWDPTPAELRELGLKRYDGG